MTATPTHAMPLKNAAHRLAQINHDFEDTITRTYWFRDPLENEIRLVHVDTAAFFHLRAVRPFCFGASTDDGEFTPASAIALIAPSDEGRSSPPEGWGDWEEAEVWTWNAAHAPTPFPLI